MSTNNFTHLLNDTVNAEVNVLIHQINSEKYRNLLTLKEREHALLTGLQELKLSKHEVFEVYTNTDLI